MRTLPLNQAQWRRWLERRWRWLGRRRRWPSGVNWTSTIWLLTRKPNERPMRAAGSKPWFHLDIDCHHSTMVATNGLGFVPLPHPPFSAEPQFAEIERTGWDFYGCCGCFANCARGTDWRGPDGRLRKKSGLATGVVVGGVVFFIAIVAMVLLILFVWSLDSFGYAVGSFKEHGSRSGI